MQAPIVLIAPLLFLATTPVRFCNPAQYAPRPSFFIARDPTRLADSRRFAMLMAQAILDLIQLGCLLERRRDAPRDFFPVFRMNQLDPVVATEDLCAWGIVGTEGVSAHLFNLIALQEPLVDHKLPPTKFKRGDDVILSSLYIKMVSLTLVSLVNRRLQAAGHHTATLVPRRASVNKSNPR